MSENQMMSQCKLCKSTGVESFFSRDLYPLCGAPIVSSAQQKQVKYTALTAGICVQCGHIMLMAPRPEDVQETIYDGFYISSSAVAADPENVTDQRVIQLLEFMGPILRRGPGKALEIGSYDGQVLYQLRKRGWEVYGCEPNAIGQEAARKYGMEIKQAYFGDGLYQPASLDLVIARFVLEHVSDPLEFLQAIHTCLRPDGHVVIDVPDDHTNTRDRVISTFVPEHVSYFGSSSLEWALKASGFEAVELLPYRGGVAAIARRSENASASARAENAELPDLLASARTYRDDMSQRMKALQSIIRGLRAENKSVVAYGGNTITLDCMLDEGLFPDQIDYIVDDDTYKTGHFLVGTNLQVHTADRLNESAPDAVLICAYFSQEAIAEKVRAQLGPDVGIIRCYPYPHLS